MFTTNENMEAKYEFNHYDELSREYFLLDNQLHGLDTHYLDDGKVVYPYYYGKKEGKVINYFKNGQIRCSCEHVNDVRHGEYISFHSNGKVQAKLNFMNDERHGYGVWYFTNGQIASEGFYTHGRKDGEYLDYLLQKTGEYFLTSKQNYINGCTLKKEVLIKDDCFCCENIYYKVVRGSINRSWYTGIKKTRNFQVIQLRFTF